MLLVFLCIAEGSNQTLNYTTASSLPTTTAGTNTPDYTVTTATTSNETQHTLPTTTAGTNTPDYTVPTSNETQHNVTIKSDQEFDHVVVESLAAGVS
jgi:hypothetical protein